MNLKSRTGRPLGTQSLRPMFPTVSIDTDKGAYAIVQLGIGFKKL